MLGGLILIDAVWLYFQGLSVVVQSQPIYVFLLMIMFAYVFLLNQIKANGKRAKILSDRLSVAIKGLLFINIAWIASGVLGHLVMTTGYDYADEMLASWDGALGFQWLDYFITVAELPKLRTAFYFSYQAFTHVAIIAFLVLALSGNFRRAEFLIESFLGTALCCVAIGAFFPAKGATFYFLSGSMPEVELLRLPGLYHLEPLHQLRQDTHDAINLVRLPGLVTFPSFHTAGGIVIAVAFLGTRVFWLAAGYATLMIAATPVFGAHYLVDLLAGAVVAMSVVGMLLRTSYYRGVLSGERAEVGRALRNA